MAEKQQSKADQIRAMREAKFAKSSGSGVESNERASPRATAADEQRRHAGHGERATEPKGHRMPKDVRLVPAKRKETELGAGVASGLPEANRKKGRPKKGEIREKPWEAAGISKAQWYRRQAEAKEK